ncbi:DUF885 domain-containing protein [Glycomyces tritici]|uniref:DUF885 domain-containing protein n=1 Tax=Glycomyces tritici TaxID=2665176 RepID=A0ABT7YS97_9ACTN|nr:DUF885 domain-containing protein [Glycomyces tritici]MDN3241249.1 DUF885 domain-containing protein [Glycomyces tritici]MDN3243272.1 DUF885 domain-containing protein [Glycomyces tritici]
MRSIDRIADQYVEDVIALSPLTATSMGVPGHDHEIDDLSPAGLEAEAALTRKAIADLEAAEPVDERERVAKDAILERLHLQMERHEAGDTYLSLNVLASPVHSVRQIFDLMPKDGREAAENIAARLEAVPNAFEQYTETLRAEAAAGRVAAERQVLEVATHCDNWNGAKGIETDFWANLVNGVTVDGEPIKTGPLRIALSDGATRARYAATKFALFLREELAPQAPKNDAVGRDRYSRASRYFIGSAIDLEETYAWGWQELARIEDDMRATCERIKPGASIEEVVAFLDQDPNENMTDKDVFRDWMQDLADSTIADLADKHFDIPEQIRAIDCKIAPTEDGAIYYTGPSEDFSRPGAMWWSVPEGQKLFGKWREKSTVYHEGVPGHHLQVGQTMARIELLNRFQRQMMWCSGHGEGWALYSERLMDELGYYDDDPAGRLGMLDAQAFRAARVIVDIGLHCEFAIPEDNPFGWRGGETWDGEKMFEFMRAHTRTIEDDMLHFEVNRYLGWAGQAPSYKVGERLWMQAREDYKARKGTEFSLKQFHSDALNLGSMGLAPFAEALGRL